MDIMDDYIIEFFHTIYELISWQYYTGIGFGVADLFSFISFEFPEWILFALFYAGLFLSLILFYALAGIFAFKLFKFTVLLYKFLHRIGKHILLGLIHHSKFIRQFFIIKKEK